MVDTHCHLDIDEYENVEEVINHMNGNIMIAASCNVKTINRVMELVNKYDNIFGVVGIHPSEIQDMNESSIELIKKCLINEKIVGIGEIGLDYHYGKDDLDIQQEYFIKQLELARIYNKPVVIHSRDSYNDTFNILKKYNDLKIDMHCYGYSKECALDLKKLGVKFGIGGVITFKNGVKLKETVEVLDMSDLLLETDSPYLSPEPFRGKENEPYNIIYVAKEIANIKNISVDKVIEETTKNAYKLFDL